MSLQTTILLNTTATLETALDFVTAQVPLVYKKNHTLTSGTGASQADQMFCDRRTINASSSENLDIAGGLTNALGATVTFAKVKALIVYAAAANTNDVLVGGAAANQWATWTGDPSDVVAVKPGGALVLVAPGATAYAVTAGTGDTLKVANSGAGTSVTYDLILVGVAA